MKGKSLITITTCNRIEFVKKFIWDYLRFVNNNEAFHFVLALDGNEPEYLEFCDTYGIPLLYSEEREGVGLSKNRIVKQFPNYNYYFFIDDDVELLCNAIFSSCIGILMATGYHHLCGNHIHNLIKSENVLGKTITHSTTGGGYFTCYTKESLETVGGWNTFFAKYKRFGHTEHSYRTMHSGLQPSPFIFIEETRKCLLVHSPPSVTEKNTNYKIVTSFELIEEEYQLIEKKTSFTPLETISEFHFNNKNTSGSDLKLVILASNLRYPLLKGMDRRKALAIHFGLQIRKTNNLSKKFLLFLKSFFLHPTNIGLKHVVKSNFKRNEK